MTEMDRLKQLASETSWAMCKEQVGVVQDILIETLRVNKIPPGVAILALAELTVIAAFEAGGESEQLVYKYIDLLRTKIRKKEAPM